MVSVMQLDFPLTCLLDEAVSDENGEYLINGLLDGPHCVVVPDPTGHSVLDGYTLTGDPDEGIVVGYGQNYTLAEDEEYKGSDWGYQPGGNGAIGERCSRI